MNKNLLGESSAKDLKDNKANLLAREYDRDYNKSKQSMYGNMMREGYTMNQYYNHISLKEALIVGKIQRAKENLPLLKLKLSHIHN